MYRKKVLVSAVILALVFQIAYLPYTPTPNHSRLVNHTYETQTAISEKVSTIKATGWNTGEVENVTLTLAVVAEGNSRVFMSNIELYPVYQMFMGAQIYIVAKDNAELHIMNMYPSPMAPDFTVNILALDNSRITIEDSTFQSLSIQAYNYSTVSIINSTINTSAAMYGGVQIDLYDLSILSIVNTTFMPGMSMGMFVNMYDYSTMILNGVDFDTGVFSGWTLLNNSFLYIYNSSMKSTGSLSFWAFDRSSISIFASTINTSNLNIAMDYFSSLSILLSTINSTSLAPSVDFRSAGSLTIWKSYVNILKTDYDPLLTYNYETLSSSDFGKTLIDVEDSNFTQIFLFGPQFANFTNVNTDTLDTILWFYGGFNYTNNKFEYNSPSFQTAPYPFYNNSLIANTWNNNSYVIGIGGNVFIENVTANPWNFVFFDALLTIDGSDLASMMTNIIRTNVTVRNSTNLMFYAYDSFIDVFNSTNLNFAAYFLAGRGALGLFNSIVQSFQFSGNVPDMDVDIADIILSNNMIINSFGGNHTIYLRNIKPISPSVMPYLSINAYKSSLYLRNIFMPTGAYLSLDGSIVYMWDTILGNSTYATTNINSAKSEIRMYNTTIWGSITANDDLFAPVSSRVFLYNNSWVDTLSYAIFADSGKKLNITNGKVVVDITQFVSTYYTDTSSDIGTGIPSIYLNNATLNATDSEIDIISILGPADLYLNNVTVNQGIFLDINNVTDPRNITINGDINGSNIQSIMIGGWGGLTINNSYIFMLTSVLTSVSVNRTFISYLVEPLYVMGSGTATLISNAPSGFSGSFITWDALSVIGTTIYGVVAFGTSYVHVADSNVTLLVAFEASKIEAYNITALDSMGGFFFVGSYDTANITIVDTAVGEGALSNSLVRAMGFSTIKIINSNISSDFAVMDTGLLDVSNSTIGAVSFPTPIYGTVYLFDNAVFSAKNSRITTVQAYLTNAEIQIDSSTFLSSAPGFIMTNSLSSNILVKNSNIDTISLTGHISTNVTLVDTNASNVENGGVYLNVTATAGNIVLNNIALYMGETYIYGATVGTINNLFTDIMLESANISVYFGFGGSVLLYKSSAQTMFTQMAVLDIESSSVGTIVTTLNDYIYINDSTIGGILLSTYYNPATLYPYTLNPAHNLTIENTVFTQWWDDIGFTGTGTITLNNGAITASSGIAVSNATTGFSNITMNWKPSNEFLGLYIDTHVYAKISNYMMSNNKEIAIIVFNKLSSTPPTISGYYGSSNIPDGYTETIEEGMKAENITIHAVANTLLDSYKILVNGTLADSGTLSGTIGHIVFDPNSYLIGAGLYVITVTVYDADGHAAAFTVNILVETAQPPTITKTVSGPIEFEIGMDAPNISWTITEDYPDTYEIFVNGTQVDQGTYSSGDTISFIGKNYLTSAGTYNVTLVATDKAGHVSKSETIITVYPAQPPTITSEPSDTTIEVGDTIRLNWTVEDRYPATYTIYVNGTPVVSEQPWSSSEPITYAFTPTTAGVYQITLEVKDQAGHTSTSTVYITVTEQPSGGTGGGEGGEGETGGEGGFLGLGTTGIIITFVIVLAVLASVLYYFKRK